MNTCPTCGARCEGSHCFRHKPRKKLSSKLSKKLDKPVKMQEFFMQIWKKKLHYSQISMTRLGKEPLTVFFHHILPKEKYPEAMFDEENIILLTLEEHDNVEMDMYKYPEVNRRRELLKIKYKIT